MKQGLQKLTKAEDKFNLLMKKEKLEHSDIDALLNKKEKEQFKPFIAELLNQKKGIELDKFINQISDIITTDTRNQLWENNQYRITIAISKLMEDYGKMPTKNQISDETGLSRTTIHKHLKDYATHPLYAEEIRKFKFMADRVLAKVFKIAVLGEGNVRAARLYFEVIGCMGGQTGSGTTINTQNNFIQVNQTKISQDEIKQLTPEQLTQFENIFKAALPQPNKTIEVQASNVQSV